jgi:hypothetical protein
MNRLEAYARLKGSEGKIFSATFIKKDGTVRHIVARIGVTKGVKGAGLSFDPLQKLLLPVYDMEKCAFRMINMATLTDIKIGGEKMEVL